MTRDDIIRMAFEASDGVLSYDAEGRWTLSEQEVIQLAAFVAAAEREACVNLAEDLIRHFEDKKISQDPLGGTREIYAIRKYQDMIHARGEA